MLRSSSPSVCVNGLLVSKERAGNLATDVAAGAARAGLGKIALWLFGTVGAGIIIPVVLILVVVIMAVIGVSAQNEEAQADESGAGHTCSISGDSAIPDEYRELIAQGSKVSQIPVEILAAQIQQESGWNPNAISPAGARGLTQFMPQTWASWGEGDPFDPAAALKAQGKYMGWIREWVFENFKSVAKSNDGQVTDTATLDLILAGYNAGIGNVQKYGGVPPFAETQNYVMKIRTMAQQKFSDSCQSVTVGDIGSGKWVHPNPGSRLTSPFGPRSYAGMSFHYGLDLAAGGNNVVVAPADMEVTFVGTGHYGYGDWVIGRQLDDPGYVFEFHHFAPGSIKVQVGQRLAVGTPIAVEGTTGNSSGLHLHFQMAPPGTDPTKPTMNSAIDPLPILRKAGVLK